MIKTMYIIKATYMSGRHAGTSYYMTKGGYVVPNMDSVWDDDAYKTEGACKAACTRMKKRNSYTV